jgi:phosphoribosyl-AMP cyclohydrolase
MSTHDHALEEGTALTPRFDTNGLITAVVIDADDHSVLMLAHMTREALDLTIKTRIGTFFSRSRGKLWVKGESSGNRLKVTDLRIDCDQDAVLVIARLEGDGVACHTGRRSCFYRRIEDDGSLSFVE